MLAFVGSVAPTPVSRRYRKSCAESATAAAPTASASCASSHSSFGSVDAAPFQLIASPRSRSTPSDATSAAASAVARVSE